MPPKRTGVFSGQEFNGQDDLTPTDGDYLEDDKVDWEVLKKATSGTTTIDSSEYEDNKIGDFCLRPFLVPLSSSRAKLTILAFPLSQADLEKDHAHYKKTAFPGLELAQFELEFCPRASNEVGKNWGCPIIPLLYLGGDLAEPPVIPATGELKARISSTLRSVVAPVVKRDLRTLQAAWTSIKESGPTALKEKIPDMLWPSWEMERQSQGRTVF